MDTLLGDRPFSHRVIPRDLIPLVDDGPGAGGYNLQLSPDLKPALEYLTDSLEDGELKHALRNPDKYAFRGILRKLDDPVYEKALAGIQDFGVDSGGPNGSKSWFEPDDPEFPLSFAIPRAREQVGILLVARRDGMVFDWARFSEDGVGLREGTTFKDLHVGTIQFILDPPMSERQY